MSNNYYSKSEVDSLLSPILQRLEALEEKVNTDIGS
uniref:SEPTUM SITE-DETERMINING PROTEIN DIVIVA CELL DIVISION, SEPTATION, CELL.4A n=1 Tax=Podoviridae sp. ct8Lf7 TaxID=2827723 RepID=A0A8S5RZZ0_9CAUD|nr:MAG TPA: SEPTUM SITE-DETERMINING PROTEIN DIVIVA CELL DIVISION, SEPTATION, CELL.4A [Podoviridae sp. ct8Lf7]